MCLHNAVIDCGTLTEIEHRRVSLSFNTAYNSMATYSCDDGYTLVGNNKRECLVTGIWSGNEPFCLGEKSVTLYCLMLVNL